MDAVGTVRQIDRIVDEREIDVVAVVPERDEDLEDEEGHDRQVIAEQTPRRQADDETDERRARHDDGNGRPRAPVDVEMVR
jgi:hypothetical protein